ncbi:hypothetical protein ACFPER_00435 [Agromyces aurantiacus]|uniref:Uncharacterized protein n=1 Tax=Agromyces aurantiacus TaxID=165814 RepID=A0ABV9QZC1_9MICO|nr:hypothetical protein [Agromyces aurantiacus]MBM7505550.1 hypothetical protein [Agromyces aurantiacus]
MNGVLRRAVGGEGEQRMQAEAEARATGFGRWAIPVVWLIALVGSGLVVGSAYAGRRDWFGDAGPYAALSALGMVFAAAVVGALALQLASRRPHGFLGRVSASVTGAAIVTAAGALALLPVVG